MRDFKGMKRQRGRNRGGGGGGPKPTHNVNRAFDSNGPDGVKIRGHAQHVFEKYQQLARDAFGSSDRVLAENYLQHAEHYFRLLRTLQPQRPPAEILGRDTFASGYDIDFEDESGVEAGAEEAPADIVEGGDANAGERPEGARFESRRDEPRGEGRRDDQRGEGRRDDRFRERGDRYEGRRDEQRGDRPRFEGQRGEGRRDEPRGEGRSDARRDEPRGEGRFEGRRDEQRGGEARGRDRDERRFERGGERRIEGGAEAPRDPLAVVEPQPVSVTPSSAFETGEPDSGSVLRSEDGSVSEAPAFLQSTGAPAEDEGRRRNRRPRRPRSFDAGSENSGGEDAQAPEAAES
jgi:hypothetical protein